VASMRAWVERCSTVAVGSLAAAAAAEVSARNTAHRGESENTACGYCITARLALPQA
jgi:hypothetical protein